MSIVKVFVEAVKAHPDRSFACHIDESGRLLTLSYQDAYQAIVGLAGKLRASGIKPGDPVVCYAEDTLTLMYSYLAVGMLRAVVAPLSPLFSEGYLKAELMDPLQSKVFITQEGTIIGDRSLRGQLIRVGPGGAHGAEHNAQPLTAHEIDESIAQITPEAPFVIQPTSGSTGLPKLVLRRHSAFLRYAHYVGQALADENTERILCAAALTHAFAGHLFATGLSLGSTFMIPRGIDTSVLLEDLWHLDPTVAPMTPRVQAALIARFYRKGSLPPEISSSGTFISKSCRLVISAGGPASAPNVEFFASHDMKFMEFYGSSEASIVALTPPGQWQAGVAGKLVDDVEAKISSEGELLVRSPGLFIEYIQDEAKTAEVFDEDGFYHTGDAAQLDSDTSLRIRGRRREMFNTPEGCHIFPGPIELAIETISAVDQAIVVGDGRPFLVALLRLNSVGSSPGWLEPAEFVNDYLELGKELQRLNAELERVEQIAAFAIRAIPFPDTVYTRLSGGKVRRNRSLIKTEMADLIDKLYNTSLPAELRVPGIERRLRRRLDTPPRRDRPPPRPSRLGCFRRSLVDG